MADYRVYFLNAHGSILKCERLDCGADETAVRQVMMLLKKDRNCHGFELWQSNRCVQVHPAHKPMHAG